MKTLQDILIAANSYLDLDASIPTGTDLATRSNYADQAIWDAAAVAQFKEFQGVYTVNVSGNASISLPAGFREFMTEPRLSVNGKWEKYGEIMPSEIYDKEPDDKYCYVLGNPREGYTAIFNNLTANCDLSMVFQRFPSGMATLTDICELPDPQFVVSKIESYVLQSRRDERFPTKDAEAERKLHNMVGREAKLVPGGNNQIRRKGSANYVLE